MKKLVLSLAAVLFAVALWPLHALAAAYPDRPITVIVPYTPGGNVDMLARGIAPAIEEELGVKLIITPTPGAGGTVGTMKMIQSRPDGYTLLIGNQTTLSMKPFLQKTRFKRVARPPSAASPCPSISWGQATASASRRWKPSSPKPERTRNRSASPSWAVGASMKCLPSR